MTDATPVIVYPPAEDGGQRVRAGDDFLGMAYGLLDVAEFLRRAGMEGIEADDVAGWDRIQWRGGGPDTWEH